MWKVIYVGDVEGRGDECETLRRRTRLAEFEFPRNSQPHSLTVLGYTVSFLLLKEIRL